MKNCQKENGLSQPDSHVSRIASPENEKRRRTSAIFGLNVGGCYANYDPKSQCLKTSQGSLFPTEDGSLMESCLTFTKAGLLRNGKLYQLGKSALPILEKEYGLSVPKSGGGWRTPDANMERGKRSFENVQLRIKEKKPLNLNDQLNAIKKGLLPEPQFFPTPTVTGNYNRKGASATSGDGLATIVSLWPTPKTNCGYTPAVHGDGGLDLQTAVTLWPTPRAGVPGSRPNKKGGRILEEEVKKTSDGQDGQLNPEWVEAMMGYPIFWTDIKKENVINKNYPFTWLDGSWENDIPRITTKKINRIRRLKCLGNSVVPEIPAFIWLLIKSCIKGEKQ